MQIERKIIIGVMGGGQATAKDESMAFELGRLIAKRGWILLNGGRSAGIMEASAKGAKQAGGLTIGILPDADASGVSRFIDIPVITGMGHARNAINVLTSDIVVACPGGAGTISEIALALKNGTPVILLGFDPEPFFRSYESNDSLLQASSPRDVVEKIERILEKR